jgi:hypothetical protein
LDVRTFYFARTALGLSAISALLFACGGENPNGSSALPASAIPDALDHHKTFEYTGAKQSFKVPAGVTSITVVALGAAGSWSAGGCDSRFHGRERGGRVFAVIPVTPSQRLTVYVGGSRGFNGGGEAGAYYSGGGASDVRVSSGGLRDRVIVAGGGGGEGGGDDISDFTFFGCGGGGGGLAGGNGQIGQGKDCASGLAGSGGTQNAGGAGGQGGSCSNSACKGNPGSNGSLGVGGAGGESTSSDDAGGGGGGGGYFGGGGGGSACDGTDYNGGGGGGGGSSYAENSATQVRMWQNFTEARGNGLVVFSWQ